MRYWTKPLNGSKADLKVLGNNFEATHFILPSNKFKKLPKGSFFVYKTFKNPIFAP